METLERSVGNLIEADSFFVVSIKLLFCTGNQFCKAMVESEEISPSICSKLLLAQ